jgi:hypothetical protein
VVKYLSGFSVGFLSSFFVLALKANIPVLLIDFSFVVASDGDDECGFCLNFVAKAVETRPLMVFELNLAFSFEPFFGESSTYRGVWNRTDELIPNELYL